jgi:hypothetical protein
LDKLTLEEAAELRDLHRRALDPTEDGLMRPDLSALSEKERRRFTSLLDHAPTSTSASDAESSARSASAGRSRRSPTS